MNGLAGCYVSTIGKPHEYFDLTGTARTSRSSFNPLPPPKRGETGWPRSSLRRSRPVSIHSPRRSEGRRIDTVTRGQFQAVSIHSPRRSEGRQERDHERPSNTKFQSTPPAEARGDLSGPVNATVLMVFQSTPPAEGRCCTARSKSLTSLCRLQSHPAQYVSGIPSAAILLSISHPIRCSTRCLANVRARISGPMIAL